jgi:hypothetical protein
MNKDLVVRIIVVNQLVKCCRGIPTTCMEFEQKKERKKNNSDTTHNNPRLPILTTIATTTA